LKRILFVLALASLGIGQQPNRPTSGFLMNYRDGGPQWPLAAQAPNAGMLLGAVYGPPGAPWGLLLGASLGPALGGGLPNGDVLDLASPGVFLQGFSAGLPGYWTDAAVPNFGVPAPTGGFSPYASHSLLAFFVPPGAPFLAPPVQAIVFDPASPLAFSASGAIQIDFKAPPDILFIQGVQNPFGFGNQSRLSDSSFFGCSQLRTQLYLAGFSLVDEFVHTAQTPLTAALLAPYEAVVLAANRTPFTPAEIALLDAFVRGGGGLVAYADFTFGIDADPNVPGGYLTTCDAYDADNAVLANFGLQILPDNFAPTTTITDFAAHPVTRGLPLGVQGEGLSLVRALSGSTESPVILADAVANGLVPGSGWCPTNPPLQPGDPIGAIGVCEPGAGRVAVTFDRNTFLNTPGFGTCLFSASNLVYAVNLFLWAARID
jgi:hypothetical protein